MTQPPPKKDVADALIERGSVFVYLDPRADGVVVPEHLRKQPQLVLQIGLGLAIPIRDLEIDDVGVSGTLSFNRSPFFCRVPWPAIFGLFGEDGMGVVWEEDFPQEVTRDSFGPAADDKPAAPLRAIEGGAAGADSVTGADAAASDPEAPSPRRRPNLRLVE